MDRMSGNRISVAFMAAAVGAFGFASSIRADSLILKNGTTVNGRVFSSTADSVTFDGPQGLTVIAHDSIDVFHFDASDVIQPKEGLPVRGKILRKVDDMVYIATEDGVSPWANGEIKKAWYGRGAAIDLKAFGQTGTAFSSQKVTIGVPMLTHQRIYAVGVRFGTHIGMMSDWRNQFVLENGTHPVATFLQFGPEAYFDITKEFFVGGGFEYLLGRKIEVQGAGSDRPSAWLVFGSGGFLLPLGEPPEFELGLACDVGYLWGKEHVDVGGNGVDGTAETFAVRPKAIMTYATSKSSILRGELGWLVARARDVRSGDTEFLGYDLDFSGLSMIVGWNFIAPL